MANYGPDGSPSDYGLIAPAPPQDQAKTAQPYNQSTNTYTPDPNNPRSQAASEAQGMGLPAGITSFQDYAGDYGVVSGGWGGFYGVLTDINQWEAATGFSYSPNPATVKQMLAAGVNGSNSTAVWGWLTSHFGAASKYPWAASGMTHDQWLSTQTTLRDTMLSYTGSMDMYPGLLQQALAKGTSAGTWLTDQLLTNPTYTNSAKTPWLKYHMTYDAFQTFKEQNKGQVTQQFGAGASDTQYAAFKGEAPVSRSTHDSAVTMPTGGAGSLVKQSTGSQVR